MAQSWKSKKVIAPTTITNALEVKNWLYSLQIVASQVIIVRDDWETMASANGTLIIANIDNGVVGAYIRYYNNAYLGQQGWTSSYDLSVDAGDSYTVLYR